MASLRGKVALISGASDGQQRMDDPVTEPICLLTGATEGVGKATAIQLVRAGFKVVLAARDAGKAQRVKQEIDAATGRTATDFMVADLGSLRTVRELAQAFKNRYPRLDVLINNAGIFAPEHTLTEDGFESTYQVNYLAHFLLTQLLLEELRKSPQGRIINLSSSVYAVGQFDPDNLQSERQFSTFAAYSASKLFMLMSSITLAERLRNTKITVNAVHPGVVRTQMMLQAPGFFRVIAYLALPFALSAEAGAATSVHLATSPQVKGTTGQYFTKSKPTAVKNRFNTPENRELLWKKSVDSLGGRDSLSP